GAFQLAGEDGIAAALALVLRAPALLREGVPDMLVDDAVGGLVALHRVVDDRDAGDLDDAGLDGVDEGEVGDDPGEEDALGVAGTLEVERGRGNVVDGADAEGGM